MCSNFGQSRITIKSNNEPKSERAKARERERESWDNAAKWISMKHLQQEAQFFYLSLPVCAGYKIRKITIENCESKHRTTDTEKTEEAKDTTSTTATQHRVCV